MKCVFCDSQQFVSEGVHFDPDLGERREIWRCGGCGAEHAEDYWEDERDGPTGPTGSIGVVGVDGDVLHS